MRLSHLWLTVGMRHLDPFHLGQRGGVPVVQVGAAVRHDEVAAVKRDAPACKQCKDNNRPKQLKRDYRALCQAAQQLTPAAHANLAGISMCSHLHCAPC